MRSGPFVDRHHLHDRFRVESEGGTFVVEQRAYSDAPDGLFTRMSVVCSGFRPAGSSPPG